MALTCPHCEKLNLCSCKNCNSDNSKEGVVIIDYDRYKDNLSPYECFYCHRNFDEQDSLEFDWDRMISEFAKKLPPEKCIEWFESNDKKPIYKSTNSSEFEFEHAFSKHFNIFWKNV